MTIWLTILIFKYLGSFLLFPGTGISLSTACFGSRNRELSYFQTKCKIKHLKWNFFRTIFVQIFLNLRCLSESSVLWTNDYQILFAWKLTASFLKHVLKPSGSRGSGTIIESLTPPCVSIVTLVPWIFIYLLTFPCLWFFSLRFVLLKQFTTRFWFIVWDISNLRFVYISGVVFLFNESRLKLLFLFLFD